MARMKITRRHVRGAWALALAAVLALLVWAFGNWWEGQGRQETRGEMSETFGRLPTLSWQGETWRARTDAQALLLIGFDQTGEQVPSGFRSGGQADFLLLLAIDHENKTILPLHIERDAITPVTVLGVTGRASGQRSMQICLSHGFGADEESRCRNTVQAVEGLLPGVNVGSWLSVDLGGIGVLNSALGGVTVTLEDDFTFLDAAMVPGASITLTNEQAEWFVRQRMGVGEGSNQSRMRRQQAFMASAAALLAARLGEDSSFAQTLWNAMEGTAYTGMSQGEMINLANRIHAYAVLPTQTLPGQYSLGEDGFMEFHVQEGAGRQWALEAFWQKIE